MGGKMSRNKGKVWERVVAAAFRLVFGAGIRRGWQAREGSDDPDIVGLPDFWCEAKHHKVVNIGAAIRQVLDAQKVHKDTRWPLVVSKSNRQDPLATMLWDDFLKLVKEWQESKAALAQVATKLAEPKPLPIGEAERRLVELLKQRPDVIDYSRAGSDQLTLLQTLSDLGIYVVRVVTSGKP